VLIIGDVLHPPVRSDIEANDSFDVPLAVALVEENDRGLIVHIAQRQPPCHLHPRIDAQVATGCEAARVAIGNEETGVGAISSRSPSQSRLLNRST